MAYDRQHVRCSNKAAFERRHSGRCAEAGVEAKRASRCSAAVAQHAGRLQRHQVGQVGWSAALVRYPEEGRIRVLQQPELLHDASR